MREKQKQKRKRKMGREGRKTIGTFVERKREALISLREGRRVKTMRGEVYISGKPNRVSYARMRSHHLNITGRSIALALFFLPRPACKNRLQFALWRLLQPIKFDSFHPPPSLPRETGEAIR